MKFNDIQPFIRSGAEYFNVRIIDINESLDSLDKMYGTLELNPEFQRGHVWTEQQQIDWIEFILKGGKSGKDFHFNTESYTSRKGIQCVDGLQRITALQKFINNEIKVFGHFFKDFEDEPRINTNLTFHINNIPDEAEVLRWYIEMNSGGTVHSKEEIQRVTDLRKELLEGK